MTVIGDSSASVTSGTSTGASGDSSAGTASTTAKLVGVLRIATGWMFLWSFLDSMFGLGFATCRLEDGSIDRGCDAAFINGGSPTWGFLNFGTGGSKTSGLVDWMAPSAPNAINYADVLYMLGMLSVGVALVFGIAIRLGGLGGAAMMALIYIASAVWPEYNPLVDDHIIIGLVCLIFASAPGRAAAISLHDKWVAVPAVADKPVLH